MVKKLIFKSEEEWKKILTAEECNVLRKEGTEPPFTGKYVYNKEKGVYVCAGCGNNFFHLILNLIQHVAVLVFLNHFQIRMSS